MEMQPRNKVIKKKLRVAKAKAAEARQKERKSLDMRAEKILHKLCATWNNCECLHFNCHGLFNIDRPMESGLVLAQQQKLLLQDILLLRLPNCKLVTLSGCETGPISEHNENYEYIGVPSAFLFAGADYTVCSLWSVYDSSTTILMVKFYELMKKNVNLSVPEALWQAQQWYRTLDDDNNKRTHILSQLLGVSNAKKLALRESFLNLRAGVTNTRHPVHWAAFVCVG